MGTNIVLDDALVEQAMRVTGIETERELVEVALRALVQQRTRLDFRDLKGKLRFYEGFDPRQAADDRTVALIAVDRDNVRAVCDLEVAPSQRRFVATNAQSLAEANFAPEAWFRAVAADGQPVGFVMLACYPDKPEYVLWRFMIDQRFQGRGYARAALQLVIEQVRAMPRAEALLLGCVPGEGSPQGFYESLGFRATGAVEDGEIIMALQLSG